MITRIGTKVVTKDYIIVIQKDSKVARSIKVVAQVGTINSTRKKMVLVVVVETTISQEEVEEEKVEVEEEEVMVMMEEEGTLIRIEVVEIVSLIRMGEEVVVVGFWL